MTSAEEDYLKAIYELVGERNRLVSTNAIAKSIDTRPASVTDMVKKLALKEYAEHRSYKGARLTEKGRKVALSAIRKQRLWEVFLVEKLDFEKSEAPQLAKQLRHVNHERMVDRLDQHLNFPKTCPNGHAIPSKNGVHPNVIKKVLSALEVGSEGVFVETKDTSSAFLKFLNKNHIAKGDTIKIIDFEEFDASFRIRIKGNILQISNQIASNLFLQITDN